MKIKIVVICLFVSNLVNAQKASPSTFGKGLINFTAKDNSYSLKLGFRMQLLSTNMWTNNGVSYNSSESSMLVRRSRIKLSGFAYSPKLKYKVELGLSNKDLGGVSSYTNNAPRLILDALIKWSFSPNFELWVGQTKLPGNRGRVVSSGNLQFVDRSLLNKRFNIDREMGVQLHHHFKILEQFIIKEKVAISQGEGRNVTSKNLGGHLYTTRLELLPFGNFTNKGEYSGGDLKREKSKKLAIGFSYSFNNNAVKNRSNQGAYMSNDVGFFTADISSFFIDLMYKYKGFSVMSEYAERNTTTPYAKNSDGSPTGDVVQTGKAFNLQSGYLFRNNWEFSGRFTNITLDNITGKGVENQYTFGVSKYILGHKLKVQSDISYLDIVNANNTILYRIQIDIHF